MNNKWTEHKILDVQNHLIKNLPEKEQEKYKLKKLNKKQEDVLMFSKKDFKTYRENNNVVVVGKIRKRQKKYKIYENNNIYPPTNFDNFLDKKKDKKVIGNAELYISRDKVDKYCYKKNGKNVKLYDVKETNNSHTVGYAYVGNNKFLQVTTFNPLLILLPLLIVLMMVLLLHHCPEVPPPIDIIDGDEITTTQPVAVEQLPNCDYLLFSETTTLTKDNPSIRLCNLKSNEGLWLISYQIYVDGEPLKDLNNPQEVYSTGAIKAGYQIDGTTDSNLNLWSRLDAGTYELKCVGTQYQEQTNEKGEHLVTPVKNTLKTTLVVDK